MQYQKETTLRDGTPCLLCSPTAADAAPMLDYLRTVCGETDNLLRYPDEVTVTVEQEERFLTERLESERSVMIAAVVDGQLVGNAGLDAPGSNAYRIRHRASMGISIRKDYWGKGLGSLLMEAVIECAERAGYTQLELEVLATNERAIALYKKHGFVIYGTNPNAIVYRDGKTVGEHHMYKTLDGKD